MLQFVQGKEFANTLLVDFSAVTEPLSLVGFMGHVTVCSSKGFANTLLVEFSAFTDPISLVGIKGMLQFVQVRDLLIHY